MLAVMNGSTFLGHSFFFICCMKELIANILSSCQDSDSTLGANLNVLCCCFDILGVNLPHFSEENLNI